MSTSAQNLPVVLIIRDGWGHNPHPEHQEFNAIARASTPVADALEREWPTALIRTSGPDVGLPPGTMGNSEVGHQNIGAGRIVDQALMRISNAINDGGFFENDTIRAAFDHAESSGGFVHLLGLVSDGQVHSDLDHLIALLQFAQRIGFPGHRVIVHAFTDGRDTPPTSGINHIMRIDRAMTDLGVGRFGSVTGRYFAMDRDHRWGRIALAWSVLTGRPVTISDADTAALERTGPGGVTTHVRHATAILDAVQAHYDHPYDPRRHGDEFMPPTLLCPWDEQDGDRNVIRNGDAVIFFNFRGDRPRQLTKAFVLDDASWASIAGGGFDRGKKIDDLYFCTMTAYEEGLPVHVAFPRPPKMPGILGQVIADAGLAQFRCAETEKFAHVTFFFNDYREAPFPDEHRELIPSPQDVSTYDQKPEMSAEGVCAAVLARVEADDGEPVIIVNFANGDMVGHTGNLEATITAIETVDACVGRIMDATLARGGSLIITADHGNAEQMWDPDHDGPHTSHTTYDVPVHVVAGSVRGRGLRSDGRLADLAPTLLDLMDMDQPSPMTGQSLLA